eukprot:3248917-Ditylum_brightwellii.AAC.1
MMEPFLCTKNHNDLQTFCDEVFIDYFQKNMRLYAVKCVICKKMIMPGKIHLSLFALMPPEAVSMATA